MKKAGAAAVLFEDQVWPKRCGHMVGKQVIDASEHAKKNCGRLLMPELTRIFY